MTEPSSRFASLSPKRQALLAQRLRSEGKLASPPPIPRRETGGPARLSYAQERLWFLDRWQPGSPAYNLLDVIELTGRLDAAALTAVLRQVLLRHAALRTLFVELDGVAFQVVTSPPSDPLPVVDLSSLPGPVRQAAARDLAAVEGNVPFDLARGPLFRARLFRLDGEEHLLVLVMHHIVADLWSFGVFIRELASLYGASRTGEPARLPDLPLQYADFAAWQRSWLQGEVLAKQLGYWRAQLAGAPVLLELPADRPRPPQQSFRGALLLFPLPAPLFAALKALGQATGGTLFMVLLAAYDALLHRYSGEEDILVGSPIAGRTRRELESVIGLFVNTLVLRADLAGNPSFLELFARVRETTLGAFVHQDLPFERLVEDLQPERDPARSPLVQALFTFQSAPVERFELPGLTFNHFDFHSGTAKFDLSLFLTAVGNGLMGAVEYSTDLFDRTRIQRLAGHFLHLLEAVTAEPGRPLAEIPLLSAAERQQLAGEWNDRAPSRGERCLHQLFAAQVSRSPEAVAVVCEGERLTYRELDSRANRWAHALRGAGVGPEARVGLCVERSLAMVVGLLAILKAGGAYVPLDPTYPQERLHFLLADSGIRVLLTQGALGERLPRHDARVLDLDTPLPGGERSAPAVESDPAHLAYIIYTSGSTGRPKGAGVYQRGFVNLLRWYVEELGLSADDRFLVLTSPGFDLTQKNLFAPLLMGGLLVLADPGLYDPREIAALVERHRITRLNSTPSAFYPLIEESVEAGLSSLKSVILGGEPISPERLAPWRRSGGLRAEVVNSYGPTECTDVVAFHRLPPPGETGVGGVPIGRPLPGFRLLVLDRHLQPAPIGVPGQLAVGGVGVGAGYLGRPDLTAAKFVPDPFADAPGGRLYWTGDLARTLLGGEIDFLGRVDHQVKVRGFRIELGEIEAALSAHPAVRQAVVLAREEEGGDRRLVAYFQAAEPAPAAEELRAFLRARLPAYMVPSAFVPLAVLPLLPNGKIDRRALSRRAPEAVRAEAGLAPRTPLEELLQGIWADVLHADPLNLSVEDNFFDLGGNSLSTIRVAARVRQFCGVDLPVRCLFEAPTIAGLALEVTAARRAALPVAQPIRTVPRLAPPRLSFAQERLWFLDQLEPASAAYNLSEVLRITGAFDPGALAASLREIAERHEVLRTTFRAERGVPVQEIHEAADLPLPAIDLRALGEAARGTEVRRLAVLEAGRPFDLTRGPVWRVTLARLAEAEHLVLVTLHHIASDAWSLVVLVQEIGALYAALVAGRPSPLPALPVQYADFAVWQREWLSGEVLTAELAYWRECLAGVPHVLDLPADRPRPAVQTYNGALLPFVLPGSLANSLRTLGRAAGGTLYMVLLAAWEALLHRITGEERLLVGSPVAGRSHREVEGLIGFFINTLVLRADLSGDLPFTTALARGRDRLLAALAHQDLPFEKLVDELKPERDPSRTPLVQVVFVFQNVPMPELKLPGLAIAPVDFDNGTAKFDLTLGLVESGGELLGDVEYNTDLFDAPRIHRLIGHFRLLLEAVAREPERRLVEIPLLSPAERQQFVAEWNDKAVYPQGTCLHQLFAAQAERTPDAVAVVSPGERLSYGVLDARTDRLARRLLEAGVGPEARVGLCVERSFAMVVGILAILKAGGAYVPLDPAYPEERLRYLLADSGVRVLLTQGALRERLPDHEALVIDLDARLDEGDTAPGPLPLESAPANLAYVIYTSGSTGRPKGVGVSHANVARLFAATEELYGFGPADTWTLFHSVAFDFSVWEIWGALLYGGTLVVVPYWVSRSPAAFRELLAAERVTVLNQTPSAFRQLIAADAGDATGLALRWVIFGGEALDLQSLGPWFARHGDAVPRLVNMYGITETTVHVTWRPLGAADLSGGAGSVIGGALLDLSLLVLDRNGQLAPLGVPGELCVGGAGLARGYLGRPELTAERFVPDPFGGAPGGRLYRSGDLARRLPNGDVEYLGRIDHQVKIRGFRIELGEIEAALAEHPAVRQAVVLARVAGEGDRRLVAYLVADAAELPEIEELRSFLRRRLPEHMLPAAFVPLAALPLSAHGKLDRAALPAPERERSALAGVLVPPRTPAERALAEVWSRVLGVEGIGVGDNFFALGGDSILSLRVRALAAERGLRFELQDLFRYQTLEELAGAAEAGPLREEAPTLEPFALLAPADRERLPRLPADVEDAYPASLLQLGMLFHGERETESTAYHNVSSFVLRGALAPAALAAALAKLAARHPILRTSFDDTRFSEPLQLVHRETRIPLDLADLRGLSPAEREHALEERFLSERRQRFEWRRHPLLRVWAHLLTEDTFELGVTEHHAILDGWSLASLLSDLFALYFAERGEGSPPPPPPAAVFRDFVALERQALASEESRRYWSGKLSGHTFLSLPRWTGRPPSLGPRIEEISLALPAEVDAALGRFANAIGVPIKSVLLAAHLRAMAFLGGGPDVLTGLVANGRPEVADGERALGLFLNTLPLRLELTAGTGIDLARAAFAAELEAMPHRRVPLAEIQRRESAGAPLFEVIFNYTHFHVLENTAGIEILSARLLADTHFALTVDLSRDPRAGGLVVSLQYDEAELHAVQARSYAELYLRILMALARDPGQPWIDALLLTDGERHQLVVEWSDVAPIPAEECIHQLFAAQADRTPDAVAVVSPGERLTYGALDARANRLAQRLRAAGVGPEERVGLCVERSFAMVVGILAILKAGGAYVPLDPAYPEERLRYLLADSGVRVLLTQDALRDRLPEHQARVIDLDARLDDGEVAPGPLPLESAPANLAYVIYTSGSTGRPKGVGVSHANVVRLFAVTEALYGFGPGDTWTLFHSHAFDFSVWEIWGALLYGGTLVVVPYWVSRSPAAFRELLAQERVTVLNQTPSAFRQLIAADIAGDAAGMALRWVIFGGEALDLPSLGPWFSRHGDAVPRLVNMYGITETTVHVTWRPIAAADLAEGAGSVIGGALPDLSLLVLDHDGQPVPLGVAGELCVGGAGLARGYLGRPERTAERFVPDPFGGAPGGRLYRSGDLARRLPDGDVLYLGRIDHQVKIRGFRIELGEIEAALSEHPAVGQAVVLARAEGEGDRRLVAYLVAGAAPLPEIEELRSFLRRRLPEHMLPAAFVPLAALPLSAHGKIDRSALPAPERERSALAGELVAPRTPAERALAEVWSRVLGVDRIGVDDNFFALGGDSILSLRVRALGAERGLRFEIEDLFRHQTLGELAGAAEGAPQEEATALAPFALVAPADRERLPADVEDAYPSSLLQLGMLFHSEREAGATAYHNVSSFVLRGALDPEALAAVLAELAARHPILRTSFDDTRWSEPLQLVHRETCIPLDFADLRALSLAERERALEERFESERRRHFDWRQHPLLRVWVHLLTADTFELGVTEHHAIADGWSFASLLSELFALYVAETGEGLPPLPPPAAIFRDFVALERQALESEESRRYWNEKLAGHTFLALPRWSGRVENPEPRMAEVSRALPAEVDAALGRLANLMGVPVKSALLAAHLRVQALLGGSPDVLTGLVANGRPEVVDGERGLGLFLNTLPLRLPLAEGTWSDLVRAAFTAELEALPHRRVPLAEIQRRESAGVPLFEVIFNYVHFHVLENTAGVEILSARNAADTHFALTVNLSRNPLAPEELDVFLQYDTAELHPAQARSYAELYLRVLSALARDPGEPWTSALLLSEGEWHQLVVEWSDTVRVFPDGPIHELFHLQAERTPDAVALVSGVEHLTYHDLGRRAARVARRLRRLGTGAGALVGLYLERSLEMVMGILGILEAGAAYLPLDPGSPDERLAFMLADAKVQVLLTVAGLASRLSGHGVPAIELLDLDDLHAGEPEAAAGPAAGEAGAGHLAYVMYTSGSTGTPKGVAVPHGSVVRLVHGTGYARFAADEVFVQLAPLSFDASILEIWGPLLHGGRLVIPPASTLSLEELGAILSRHGVSTLWLTAGLFHQMVEENLAGLSSVRQLLAGGDALSPVHARKLLAALPGTALINGYGPTEGTTFSCCHPVVAADLVGSTVPIGRPIANARAYVLDDLGGPVPIGAEGLLYIGGDGLARGYLHRPDWTAERFVPDAIGWGRGDRLYGTGDRVRHRPDGTLEFLGRRDGQVKLRGFRIELGEVESALAAHPAVEVSAVLLKGAGEARHLAAYLVLRGGGPEPADLRGFLRQRLPGYMVPQAWNVLPALPLTANGKVDRRALSRIEPLEGASRPELTGYMAPRTQVEEVLAGIWSDLLGRSRVGVEDNFFDLGGHSLKATQLISRLRRTFDVELPLAAVFDTPTLASLARSVETAMRAGHGVRLPAIERAARDVAPPLSFAQQRLWFIDQLVPDNPFYNMPFAVRLCGALDAASLAAALLEITWRHEALRTCFPAVGGRPVQEVGSPAPTVLPRVDLGALPLAVREREAERLAAAAALRPFDLARGPLLRTTLLALGAAEHVLLLVVHHIVSDGWSMGVLVHELATFYGAFSAGRPSPLPPLPVQYADFAVWQHGWLHGPALEALLAPWRRRLANLPVLELPVDRPRQRAQRFRGGIARLPLSAPFAAALQELSRERGVTLFMTLLTAFQTLLYRYTGQVDFAQGSPIANRTHREIEELIGFFVNSLVLRLDLAGDPSFAQGLERAREVTLEAFSYQDLPFERLVEELRPERSLAHNPLFQVVLAVQNTPAPTVELPGLSVSSFGPDAGITRFDFELHFFEELAGALEGMLVYDADLFDAATAARLLGHLQNLLAAVLADPEARISALPLLSPAERCQLAGEWNDTAAPRADRSLHEIFDRRAAERPETLAVVSRERSLTYGELRREANRLAHHLRGLGVGPEVRVGLLLERSPELVVAVLAVLKSGGAYVPLDPGHPEKRLALIVEDARLPLVLSRSGLPRPLGERVATVLVDRESEAIGSRSSEDPAGDLGTDGLDHLAYVLYTSGSTGVPKGVMVPHRGVVNYLTWAIEAYGLGPERRSLLHSSIGFDLTVTALLGTLLAGGEVHLVPEEAGISGIAEALREAPVQMLKLTPSHLEALGREMPPESAGRVDVLVVGGEALSGDALDSWRRDAPGTLVVNEYGPTEATVGCAVHAAPAAAMGSGTIPIGRPIANSRVHVLSPEMELLPIGAHGELFLGGDGLARCYLGRPDLTAERFLPDPLGTEPGGRLYRTGDFARELPDGTLDFLGRKDQQVKVRGYRIELGEIEAALLEHPAIAAATVTILDADEGSGSRRLVAYAVLAPEAPALVALEAELVAEQVEEWRLLYDATYRGGTQGGGAPADAALNLVGWDSSYTGEAIPAEEMREWVEETVAEILSRAPARVLEVGCGTGLLLQRIAPRTELYVGTDFSQAVLGWLAEQIGDRLPQVRLLPRLATDLSGLGEASFDAVIVNSVVQYFPSAEYLAEVVEGAVRRVADGGFVFLGDLRSLSLLAAFHTEIELGRAPAALSLRQLRQRVQSGMGEETELAVDPAFFTTLARRLPRLAGVEIFPHRGRAANELNQYRYQVVLHVGAPASPAGEPAVRDLPWLDWETERLDLAAVRRRLASLASAEDIGSMGLGLLQVPNVRVSRSAAAARQIAQAAAGPETAGELREALRHSPPSGVDPEDFRELVSDLPGAPFSAEIRWGRPGPEGRYEVIFRRPGSGLPGRLSAPGEAAGDPAALGRFTNRPLLGRAWRRLVPRLRADLRLRLIEAMVPADFVILQELPLTRHGKLDRGALPRPDRGTRRAAAAPRSELETQLTQIWAEVLGLTPESIGIEDSFFDLGGHSLLAVHLMARIEKQLARRLSVADLFQATTIEQLAARLAAPLADTAGVPAPAGTDVVFPLATGGSGTPLFCVHPGGGSVFAYRDLARRLGGDRPVYGLQAPGLDEGEEPLTAIEALAARFAAEIRAVQPAGPYLLAGWSLGGIVAYELARQLAAEPAAEVAVLALLDSVLPDAADAESLTEDEVELALLGGFVRNLGLPVDACGRLDSELPGLASEARLPRVQAALLAERLLPDGDFPLARLFAVFRNNIVATYRYRPEPYPGRITLFLAEDEDPETRPDFLGCWSRLAAGGVALYPAPGGHYTLLSEPHVGHLAERLRAELGRAGRERA